jgi:hypothetical protein
VTRIAQQEVDAGLVPFETFENNLGNSDKDKKPKSAK